MKAANVVAFVFNKGNKMRIAVIIGYDEETGKSEALASGTPAEMKKITKGLILENTTKWPKLRFFEQGKRSYKLAAPKKSRGKAKEA